MLPRRHGTWCGWILTLIVVGLLGTPGPSRADDLGLGLGIGNFSAQPLLPVWSPRPPHPRFIPNFLPTTPYGPAWADIVLSPSNFLLCKGGPVALCYYSGAGPGDPSEADLSCEVEPDGLFARCKCLEIPAGSPYFVDINSILNLHAYLETVAVCGADGSQCLPTGRQVAPVCASINNSTLIPGAQVISAFSLYLESTMPIGQTSCLEPAPYAGCMTAPCQRTDTVVNGLTIDECRCPLFTGPYQVGQDIEPSECNLANVPPPVGGADLVWSAAYNPLEGNVFPTPPGCIPDAPGESGCPLLPTGTIPPPPADVSCRDVCAEYRQSRNWLGIEVGFTCDATLCTATPADADLVRDACSGLGRGPLSAILQLETAVGYSCSASQICNCRPGDLTNDQIAVLNQRQRERNIAPQCDLNGTLCGAQP